ncbi:hypothetical protein LCGC14_2347510, partial [marine sediment metagenome]
GGKAMELLIEPLISDITKKYGIMILVLMMLALNKSDSQATMIKMAFRLVNG